MRVEGLRVEGRGVEGWGLRVEGSGPHHPLRFGRISASDRFVVRGSGFGVQGSGFRVQGLGLGADGVGLTVKRRVLVDATISKFRWSHVTSFTYFGHQYIHQYIFTHNTFTIYVHPHNTLHSHKKHNTNTFARTIHLS